MTEPLFIDCLTDAQFWSLLDSGVLHAYTLPGEVYERLERLAPAHGCYLFTWPAGVALPPLQDIAPSLPAPGQEPPGQAQSQGLQTRVTSERIHSEIKDFCARVNSDIPAEGAWIHVISTNPVVELRAGPYLEPPAHDLTAMSMPELEAYLDAVLRIDDGDDVGSTPLSASDPLAHHLAHHRNSAYR
jgi:hypothetical protein